MNEPDIQSFWDQNPCGDLLIGGLRQRRGDYEAFFTDYDEFRYRKEAHILRCLDEIDFDGKRVLEIGLGQGADSEQIIRRGALWSGRRGPLGRNGRVFRLPPKLNKTLQPSSVELTLLYCSVDRTTRLA